MGMYRMTIAGLYEYDQTLFDHMIFPADADKQNFIDSLLLSYGDCEPLYPDGDFMKQSAIPAWSKKWQDSIERVFLTLKKDYNPIENYDRQETWTDSPDIERNTVTGGSDTNTLKAERGSVTSNSGSDTMEQKVSAFDSSNYQPSQEEITSYGSATKLETSGQDVNSVEYGRTEKNTEKGSTIHTGQIHGNIGVTTSQQMAESELQLRKQSFIDYCTGLFASDLLILVY